MRSPFSLQVERRPRIRGYCGRAAQGHRPRERSGRRLPDISRPRRGGAQPLRLGSDRDDGTVEAVFEGDAEGVEALIRYCEYGSSGANVTHVVAVDEAPEGLSGFEL